MSYLGYTQRSDPEVLGLSWGAMEEFVAMPTGYKLGDRIALRDGRTFHVAKAGAVALAAGKLLGSPLTFAEREDTLTKAVAVGAKEVTYTAVAAITADQFADGFLVVADATGEGLQYKISTHPAIAAAATGIITLEDPIITALDLTTDVILQPSIFKNLILCPDQAIFATGVAPIPVTANYFFLVQTWGPCVCLAGDSLGNAATERWAHSAGAAGALVSTAGGVAGRQLVGFQIGDSSAVVNTDHFPYFLTIIP